MKRAMLNRIKTLESTMQDHTLITFDEALEDVDTLWKYLARFEQKLPNDTIVLINTNKIVESDIERILQSTVWKESPQHKKLYFYASHYRRHVFE